MMQEDKVIYTITQLNREVREILEESYPTIWVEGEISNLARPSSGHLYFSLKDPQALVRCALFQMRARSLRFSPKDGLKVLVQARVSFYEPRGDFQLIVEHMEELGDGILRQRFEALKQKLSAEGLFDPAAKKPIPSFPTTVGVITSPTGAAIRDILSVLKRRFPLLDIIIYPTAVQGAQAVAQILQALKQANMRQECNVIIMARGGGSLEDLWSFNEEAVARAIAASNIPIVTGIGHEVDFTIADFVADHRAPTPSAAAELISPDRLDWLRRFQKCGQQLHYQLTRQLSLHQQHLNWLMKRLRHPQQLLEEKAQRLDDFEQRLKRAMQQYLQVIKTQFAHLSHRLDTISPLATLHRGYAIVARADGEIVRTVSSVRSGDRVQSRVSDGVLKCVVE